MREARPLPELKTPVKVAAHLLPAFSGVALNDIDYLVERETGFEPATSTLARLHSTTELFPQHRNIYYRCGASVNPIARAAIAHKGDLDRTTQRQNRAGGFTAECAENAETTNGLHPPHRPRG